MFLAVAFVLAAIAFVLVVLAIRRKGWAWRLGGSAGAVLAATLAASLSYSHLEHKYQADMDEVRVRDVHKIAKWIEEYERLVGAFPLAQSGAQLPVVVHLTPLTLESHYMRPPPGRPGTVLSYQDFVEEMRAGLGADLALPVDPQRFASGRPNWYQYQLNGRRAVVGASLANPRPGTRQVGPGYHKYEVVIEASTE